MPFTLPSLQRPSSASPTRPAPATTTHHLPLLAEPTHTGAHSATATTSIHTPSSASSSCESKRHSSPQLLKVKQSLARLELEEHLLTQKSQRDKFLQRERTCRECEVEHVEREQREQIRMAFLPDWFLHTRASVLRAQEQQRHAIDREAQLAWSSLSQQFWWIARETRERSELFEMALADVTMVAMDARQWLRTNAHLQTAPQEVQSRFQQCQMNPFDRQKEAFTERTPSFESLASDPNTANAGATATAPPSPSSSSSSQPPAVRDHPPMKRAPPPSSSASASRPCSSSVPAARPFSSSSLGSEVPALEGEESASPRSLETARMILQRRQVLALPVEPTPSTLDVIEAEHIKAWLCQPTTTTTSTHETNNKALFSSSVVIPWEDVLEERHGRQQISFLAEQQLLQCHCFHDIVSHVLDLEWRARQSLWTLANNWLHEPHAMAMIVRLQHWWRRLLTISRTSRVTKQQRAMHAVLKRERVQAQSASRCKAIIEQVEAATLRDVYAADPRTGSLGMLATHQRQVLEEAAKMQAETLYTSFLESLKTHLEQFIRRSFQQLANRMRRLLFCDEPDGRMALWQLQEAQCASLQKWHAANLALLQPTTTLTQQSADDECSDETNGGDGDHSIVHAVYNRTLEEWYPLPSRQQRAWSHSCPQLDNDGTDVIIAAQWRRVVECRNGWQRYLPLDPIRFDSPPRRARLLSAGPTQQVVHKAAPPAGGTSSALPYYYDRPASSSFHSLSAADSASSSSSSVVVLRGMSANAQLQAMKRKNVRAAERSARLKANRFVEGSLSVMEQKARVEEEESESRSALLAQWESHVYYANVFRMFLHGAPTLLLEQSQSALVKAMRAAQVTEARYRTYVEREAYVEWNAVTLHASSEWQSLQLRHRSTDAELRKEEAQGRAAVTVEEETESERLFGTVYRTLQVVSRAEAHLQASGLAPRPPRRRDSSASSTTRSASITRRNSVMNTDRLSHRRHRFRNVGSVVTLLQRWWKRWHALRTTGRPIFSRMSDTVSTVLSVKKGRESAESAAEQLHHVLHQQLRRVSEGQVLQARMSSSGRLTKAPLLLRDRSFRDAFASSSNPVHPKPSLRGVMTRRMRDHSDLPGGSFPRLEAIEAERRAESLLLEATLRHQQLLAYKRDVLVRPAVEAECRKIVVRYEPYLRLELEKEFLSTLYALMTSPVAMTVVQDQILAAEQKGRSLLFAEHERRYQLLESVFFALPATSATAVTEIAPRPLSGRAQREMPPAALKSTRQQLPSQSAAVKAQFPLRIRSEGEGKTASSWSLLEEREAIHRHTVRQQCLRDRAHDLGRALLAAHRTFAEELFVEYDFEERLTECYVFDHLPPAKPRIGGCLFLRYQESHERERLLQVEAESLASLLVHAHGLRSSFLFEENMKQWRTRLCWQALHVPRDVAKSLHRRVARLSSKPQEFEELEKEGRRLLEQCETLLWHRGAVLD